MTFPQQALLCLYRYDPLDRLISHTQSQASPLQRFYCKSRLATEVQGARHHSIVQHDDQLLAQQQRQDDVLDTTLLATDLQRSILQTLKANQPLHPMAYSPYGHRRPENGLLSLLGFNGERPDPVTGHYLLGNGYRAFNAVLMRFNSPDSWSPFGKGGLNSYTYCLGDPVNASDPTGHSLSAILMAAKSSSKPVGTAVVTPIELIPIPAPNSLEGTSDLVFKMITSHLDQIDMDNLATLSKQLNKKSTVASISNLKSHVSLHKKNKHLIGSYLSNPDFPSSAFNVDGKPVLFNHPRRQGIGTAAFKKLDSSVVGGESLRRYINKVDRDAGFSMGVRVDYRTLMQAKYVRVADELLRSLNE